MGPQALDWLVEASQQARPETPRSEQTVAINITEAAGEDTQDRLVAKRDHARDDTQVWVDEKVKDLIKRYHEAKDPAPSKTAPYLRLEVKKDERPDLRRMVNRAFTLISSGADVPNLVPAFYLDGKGKDGNVVMKFNVQPAPEKAEKDGEAEKASEPQGATQEPQGEPQEPEAPKPSAGLFRGKK